MKKTLFCIAALLGATNFANASVITDYYGDVDNTYSFTGDEGFTDTHVFGTQSWSQSFAVDGAIESASVEIGHAQLGYYVPSD